MAVEDSNASIFATGRKAVADSMESLFGGNSAEPEAAQSFAASEFQALMGSEQTNSGLTEESLMQYLHEQGVFGGSNGAEGLDGKSFGDGAVGNVGVDTSGPY